MLGDYANRGGAGWRVIQQTEKQGFVRTANLGMRSCSGDIILLNSDTIPASNWLTRLTECAASVDKLATATPWSNNGEIVSLPTFCVNNPMPSDPHAVASAIGNCSPPDYPEIPTAVGFCMLITRKAIELIGYFDQQSFGAGYGEENDFSLRASAAGLRNVLCDDAWVGHVGNQSFGPRGLQPSDASMQRLLHKHPGYLEMIQAYITNDPLAERRAVVVSQLERNAISLV